MVKLARPWAAARSCALAVVVLLCLSCTERTARAPSGPTAAGTSVALSNLTLNASGDTYLKSGSPNQNQGGETFVRLQQSGKNRGLLFFDANAIKQAIGSGSLVSASLELTIDNAGNNWGATGRPIALHRLKKASAEYSATWSCAIDSSIANSSADCSGATAWNLDSNDANVQPWQSPATATATITTNQTGVVTFNVSADVSAIVANTWAGYGWLLKKVDETAAGSVDFKSREQNVPARLVLQVQGGAAGSGGGTMDAGIQRATIAINADNHVRQGSPNQNYGATDFLRIQASGRNRAIFNVTPSQIQTALGTNGLVRATLELTITQTFSNWGPDRALGVHRMRQGWTELASTWNCSSDSNPSNSNDDCSGATAWAMWRPDLPDEQEAWVNPPTSTALISSEQTGTVTFDVTKDVGCYLQGFVPFYGMMVKKEAEQQAGHIEFASRETVHPPVLLLEYTAGSGVTYTATECTGLLPDGGVADAGVDAGACTPTATTDVTCNGVDDDCNGQKDEDFEVVSTTCGQGVCAAVGELSCANGTPLDSCAPGAATGTDANCDGINQDCDGHTDEQYAPSSTNCGIGPCLRSGATACVNGVVQSTCVAGTPASSDATCDGSDDDCNGVADDDFAPSATSCGADACSSSGVTSCVAGHAHDSCVPPCESACADGVDEDFDGVTDCADPDCAQAASCLVGAPCTGDEECAGLADADHYAYCDVWTYPGGYCLRQCDSTIADTSCPAGSICSPTFGSCVPNCDAEGGCPRAEQTCQVSTYFGSYEAVCRPSCDSSSCLAGLHCDAASNVCFECQPTDPSCDGADEDCDGVIDEDFVPEHTTCGTGGCSRTGIATCVEGHYTDNCAPGTACEADCANSADDDGDSLVDCGDVDCSRQTACAHVGSPCREDFDCAHAATEQLSARCVTDMPGGYCVLPCDASSPEDPCPAGSYCQDDTYQCMTACDASGGCADDHQHCVAPPQVPASADRVCAPTCADGCRSWQRCDAQRSLCIDCQSDDATCDGQDDDCNGVADDDFVVTPSTCGTGGCKRSGSVNCVAGQVVDSCAAGVGCESDCANADDEDGDGLVDCDDHDCFIAPECAQVGSPCTDDIDCAHLSESSAATAICDHGYPGGYCTFQCDRTAVDACPEGSSCQIYPSLCVLDCDASGGCADPEYGCQSAPTHSAPAPFCRQACAAGCPADRYCDSFEDLCLRCEDEDVRCDGLDQDCDGVVDDDFTPAPTTCGHGTCMREGSTTCVQGLLTVDCVPEAGCENDCGDAADDDGDGLTDCADPECSDSPECRIGEPCTTDEDCAVHGSTSQYEFLCISGIFPGGYCSRQCDEADPRDLCPEGNECFHDEPFCVRSCNAADGCDAPGYICEGMPDYLLAPDQICRPSCDWASCTNGELCNPATNLCSGCEADDHNCDGLDEDCDGSVDEDYEPQSATCGVGACERTGVPSCVSGAVQSNCVPGAAAATDATCNAVDEDCNGASDEDYVPSYPSSDPRS